MARRAVKRHTVETDGAVSMDIIERQAERYETAAASEDGFYEDSELTIIVDWSGQPRGSLSSGITQVTQMDPDAPAGNVDLYVLPLRSFVGKISFALETGDGQRVASVDYPVRRRKLASDQDLEAMERHWVLSNMPVDYRRSRQVYDEAGVKPGEADPEQWAMLTRNLLRPLSTAARSIDQRPKKSVEAEQRTVPGRAVRRPQVTPNLAVLRGSRRVRTNAPRWGPDSGAEALAARDARRVLHHIRSLRSEIEKAGRELDPELAKTFRKLEGHLQRVARKASPNARPKAKQNVLHDGRYRLLHRASLLSRRAADIEEGPLQAFRPPTSALYEEWCAWAVIEELAPDDRRDELRSELGSVGTRRSLLLREEPRNLRMTLQYDMAVGPWSHKPDLILRLEDDERVVIMDVKYRGTDEGLTKVPDDAVHELHRYRDVFKLKNPEVRHKEAWAAILHPAPGWTDGDWEVKRRFEMSTDDEYRVGSVPLSPSLREPLAGYLSELGLRAEVAGSSGVRE